MSYNFWQGELIKLRAVEQKDLDEIMHSTSDEEN
jgi:hypothetical protein